MKITSGKVPRPQKVVIYGPEGIGKTTFAAAFPEPLFIDTEGSTYHMDVRRVDKPGSWTELLAVVRQITKSSGICKTLVLDTADWAEQLCVAEVCAKYKKQGIEDFGYGKGYTYLQEEFGRLLNELEDAVNAGIGVVLTAHAKMRKFEQPDEMGSYDRWEMKLTKQVAPMVKEWADMVLFANYKTYVVATDDSGKKHKAQGGKRVMFTSHHPCWDAKNRHGLPDEIPLDYSQIAHCIEESTITAPQSSKAADPDIKPIQSHDAAPESYSSEMSAPQSSPDLSGVPANLASMMRSADVAETEVREVIAQRGYYPMDTPWSVMDADGFIAGWLLPLWDKVVEIIKANPNRLPF